MIVSKGKLAEILGMSRTQVDNYQKAGMPFQAPEKKGLANRYDTADCIRWLVERKSEKLDYNAERTRLTKLQADKQELEIKIMEGELLRADDVKTAWTNIFNQIKSNLLAIPTRAATLLQGVESQTETRRVIEKLLRETLDKVAGADK